MIATYLEQLSDALQFDPALSARVLQEVRDHLEEALSEEQLEDRQEAERRVVERFGDPQVLAAQFVPLSLMRITRRASIAIVLAIVAVMVMMKARAFWYLFVQWTLNEDARALAGIVITVDGLAFWLAAAVAIASALYLACYPTPARLHDHYRRHLHRTAFLFILAAIPLGISVTGDLVLTALRLRTELGVDAVVPLLSLAIEIGCIAAIAHLIVDTTSRVKRAETTMVR